MLANSLVRFLAIAARAHRADNELFGRHEWQLVAQTTTNARRMHLEPARDVLHEHENRVRREKALRNHQPAVRAVVQRALEELHAVRQIRVRLELITKRAREAIRSLRIGLRLYAIAENRSAPSRTAPRSRRPTGALGCLR